MLVMLVAMVVQRWSTLLQAHSVPSFKSLEASASSPAPSILIVASFSILSTFPKNYLHLEYFP